MANKKFSEFTVKTSTSDVDFVVGYDGTDNVRITPANLTGGGGASSLNGLTDCLVDTGSLYVGEVPAGLSGNPQGNTVLGIDAGNSLTTGTNNVAIGFEALSTATATNNKDCVAIGYRALKNQDAGVSARNIAIGFEAGRDLTSVNANVLIGSMVSRVATTGTTESVVVGNFAMNSNTGAAKSVVIGNFAGSSGSGGDGVSIGYQAGQNNTNVGHHSIGYQAGFSQTSGASNTNIGYQAGYSNTTSGYNTNMGYEAGKNNTGQKNTFIGSNVAGTGSGSFNVSVGVGSSLSLSSGTKNTSLGRSAGDLITTGQNNSCLGYQANPAAADSANSVTLGNSSVATLRCAVTSITSLSDERDKSEIKDLEYGLAFIDALQPREFVWDNRPETDKDGEEFYSANKGKKDFGFIAQEVRELDNDTLRLVYTENEDKLELSYGKLVPILVKAIQELKEEVELLKS